MSHADDVIPWGPMPGPVTGKRTRRWWLLLAGLAVIATAATGVTAVTVQVWHFLYGSVPLAYIGPGFGTGGWGSTGVGSPWDTPVVSPDGRMLYVPSGTKTITPVDTATRKAAPRIRLSGPGTVARMAVTPDSRTLFAAMLVESSTVPGRPLARVDLRTGRETGQVDVPGGADDFVLSRDGKTLYVVSEPRYIVDKNNNGTGEVHSALYAVSAATGRIERQVPALPTLLDGTLDMVLSPDGGTLYLTTADNSGEDYTVTSVSLRTGDPGVDVGLDGSPMALAVAPDGRTLYVATNPGSEKEAEQARPYKVTAIDTATSRVRASLPWKVPPSYLTMAPNGKTLWVVSTTGEEWTTADNTVTPVDVATFQPGPSLRTSGWLNHQSSPTAAAISPDSRTLYLAVRNGLETFRVALPTRTKPRPGPGSRARAQAAQRPDRPRSAPRTEIRPLRAPAQFETTGPPGRMGGSVPSQAFLTSPLNNHEGEVRNNDSTPPPKIKIKTKIKYEDQNVGGNPETPRHPERPVSGFPVHPLPAIPQKRRRLRVKRPGAFLPRQSRGLPALRR